LTGHDVAAHEDASQRDESTEGTTAEPRLGGDLASAARAWLAIDPDPVTKDQLEQLLRDATDPKLESHGRRIAVTALAERFAGRLAFGTAGLRAELGAGPMRMNRVVVRQAAAGLVRWLGDQRATPASPASDRVTVVIGYDARHNSDVFALDTARVVAAAGGRALLLTHVVPTPTLAYAVRRLGADAGVMCTASHNPPRDNGYKVYLDDGAQIIPPIDREIAAAIDAVAGEGDGKVAVAAEDDPAIERLDRAVIDAYIDHAVSARVVAAVDPSERRHLSIVYTPLHGVGRDVAVEVFALSGFDQVYQVQPQAEPDPDFPTVAFPNPEEPGALDLALAEARRLDADVVLANDPDADRLGVAVPAPAWQPDGGEGWRILTGNEIGALLGEFLLAGTTGDDRLVVSTFVSSRLLRHIAAFHGAHHVEVLTGFKWVVRPALADPNLRFVFGFEEALGFSVDPYVRDKDGITAATAFAELLAWLRASGGSVWDVLETLSRRHGHFASTTWSVRFTGDDALTRMAAVVDAWRTHPPQALADLAVERVTDMAKGEALPPTDAVVVDLAGGARVIVRPSGTEPKVKFYLETVVAVGDGPDGYVLARQQGDAAVEALRVAVAADLGLSP
jgi:phosphomannomutase